jgi:5-methyltetrahydrofolate--homocysteine methyltransferase
MSPEEKATLLQELKESQIAAKRRLEAKEETKAKVTISPVRSQVNREAPVYLPPDYNRHIYRNVPIHHLRPYLNEQMLLGKHLGIRGNVEQLIAEGDLKTIQLKQQVDELLTQLADDQLLHPHGMYQFFPAQADGNDILIYDPKDPARLLERFSFPRQTQEPYLCLADFLRPVESGTMDVVGFLAVTAGMGVREIAEQWKENGDYLRSHMIQAVALELAEAFAERLHHIMRDHWGFPDPVQLTMKERFAARYQGIRVSFGYPACPDLEDQRKLFRLIRPEEIGIKLTEGCMMEPEASVSAMVFSHPQARYFNAV